MSNETLEMIGKAAPMHAGRDAVHIAVIPQVAGRDMERGEFVIINGDIVGVVDPFLDGGAAAGTSYWLFLLPRTIQSLRHVWTHPAFNDEKPLSGSAAWLRDFAATLGGFTLEELVETTRYYTEGNSPYSNDSICMGKDLSAYLEPTEEFWRHYENYTGKTVNRDLAPKYFRCAC